MISQDENVKSNVRKGITISKDPFGLDKGIFLDGYLIQKEDIKQYSIVSNSDKTYSLSIETHNKGIHILDKIKYQDKDDIEIVLQSYVNKK